MFQFNFDSKGNNLTLLIFHRESKDDFEPAADAGGGEEVGEDAGDRPQPAEVGAEDEV